MKKVLVIVRSFSVAAIVRETRALLSSRSRALPKSTTELRMRSPIAMTYAANRTAGAPQAPRPERRDGSGKFMRLGSPDAQASGAERPGGRVRHDGSGRQRPQARGPHS